MNKLLILILLCVSFHSSAHHVLGRPAYSLNEDSNTPPSMVVETQIGDYSITYMVFPAFPQPRQRGRLNVYATRIDNGKTYEGQVSFSVRNDSWLNMLVTPEEELIGTQVIDDGVYRQGFVFEKEGDYIIQAQFIAEEQDYRIDFPLRIGKPSALGPLGITISLLMMLLIGVNFIKRKAVHRARFKQEKKEQD